MSSSRTTCMRPGSASEREVRALAAIYFRAIERLEQAKAAGVGSTNGDEAKIEKEEGGRHVKHLTNKSSGIAH